MEISNSIPQDSEVGDAFYTNAEFTKDNKALTIPTVTLTRPFMKLTIAEKNAERFTSCNQVIVRFNTLYQFDVATGNATGTADYNVGATNGTRNYGTDITIGGKTCKTLICLYVFANAADGTMGDIKLEFTASEEGKSLPAVTIPAGIPLKRNYRVNAAGNLIGEPSSSTVNMTVDINSDWTTPDEEYDNEVALVKKVLDAVKTSGSDDDAEGYHYTIATAEQLAALATLTNNNAVITGCTAAKYSYANYKLDADINLQDYSLWTPIGGVYSFEGNFDGQGHTISKMTVAIESNVPNAYTFAGLFGGVGGKVSNLIVEGTVSAKGAYFCYAGGICGRLGGTIEFCRFNGTASSTTNNESWNYAGGIMGGSVGIPTITGCIANAKVTISGGKEGSSGAGGLTGYINGRNCKYSAWNSDSSGGTSDMIGKNSNTDGSVGTGNTGFTTISALNALLEGINNGVSESTYKWQAGDNGTDYPKLVQRTPVVN